MKQHEYDTNVEQSEMNGTGLLEMHMYSSLGNQRALYYHLFVIAKQSLVYSLVPSYITKEACIV